MPHVLESEGWAAGRKFGLVPIHRSIPPVDITAPSLVHALVEAPDKGRVEAASGDKGWSRLASVGHIIIKQRSDFDAQTDRHTKLSELFTFTGLFEIPRQVPGDGKPAVVYARDNHRAKLAPEGERRQATVQADETVGAEVEPPRLRRIVLPRPGARSQLAVAVPWLRARQACRRGPAHVVRAWSLPCNSRRCQLSSTASTRQGVSASARASVNMANFVCGIDVQGSDARSGDI
ncbi:hypothetical protein GCM10023205_81620 [Yinghuangia aomiensis]|uniref:Uncharacterized protein n=1 Tax=Yinghuangia aomiensis TaxID=676205 RepID=A0ABP9IEH7_9ACTN